MDPQPARAITRILWDESLRGRLGRAARELVVAKYSMEIRRRALSDYFRALERT